MKVAAIYKESVLTLTRIYDEREAESIVNILFEDLLHISRIQRLTNAHLELTKDQVQNWHSAMEKLKNAIPIQHITGICEFYCYRFLVNEHTLIPRPETEELVRLIISDTKKTELKILDIGTGSGCIAISLALGLTNASVEAWDISHEALKVADKNAKSLNADVSFHLKDALKESTKNQCNIIVSNPPYIPNSEMELMHSNVTKHEPGTALFVPDTDPLIFYRKIGELGLKSLGKNGKLYFEIHENFGPETKELLKNLGYQNVQIHQDLNGKDRMISANNP